MAVLRDLGASIVAALDFRSWCSTTRMAAIAALIDVMARDLRAEFKLRTFALHGSAGIKFEGFSEQERAYGFHAGEVETAFLLASVPELVDRSAYTSNYIADVAKPEALLPENAPATFAWLTRDIAPSGVMGDPRPATAENGARWLDQAATRLAAALEAMIQLSGSDHTMSQDCAGRLRQRRAPRTRRALPHVRRRRAGFRSLLSSAARVRTRRY